MSNWQLDGQNQMDSQNMMAKIGLSKLMEIKWPKSDGQNWVAEIG